MVAIAVAVAAATVAAAAVADTATTALAVTVAAFLYIKVMHNVQDHATALARLLQGDGGMPHRIEFLMDLELAYEAIGGKAVAVTYFGSPLRCVCLLPPVTHEKIICFGCLAESWEA